ncbi:MAG: 4Fe-4S binding protein [Desulfofustis sp.]|nr:4Fe-4S binding protein [Desulfofustis sp.]
MKVFVLDLSVCNGCYCCQIACKDEHVGNDWTPYAKPQPDTGQFWIGISETVHGHVPHVKVSYLPKLCHHCDDAPCIEQCEAGAIYKRDDGLVIIDPDKCVGCKLCADTCPHDAIFFNEELNLAQKCTGCAHLLDNDPEEWSVPRCVDQCPTEALRFGEEEEFADFIAEAEPYRPEAGTKSRLYYQGLPKKFIAGTVYEPNIEEVVIGATCTLTDTESGQKFGETTNNFGDFWIKGLPDDRSFTLTIEKDGYSKVIEGLISDIDRGLGDIPLDMKG